MRAFRAVSFALFHGIFQGLAGDELGNSLGLDLNLLTGLRIAALSGFALIHLERTEAHERNRVLLFKGLCNTGNHTIHRRLGILLAPHDFGHLIDQISLIYILLLLSEKCFFKKLQKFCVR